MRINKYLATIGVASRRKAEKYVLEGRIKINGNTIYDLSTKVDLENDIIELDGVVLSKNFDKKIYILLNKPEGYITTVKDQFNRKNVLDLINDIDERLYPVGRLDYETSGLLLLTNDGDLTYKITHPKHEIDKIYLASVKGIPSQEEIKKFERGLKIDDYITSSAKLQIIKKDSIKDYSVCKITIHEGHNRQVRKMLETIGHPVMNLKRIQLGNIKLGNLEKGEYRHLTKEEVEYLKND